MEASCPSAMAKWAAWVLINDRGLSDRRSNAALTEAHHLGQTLDAAQIHGPGPSERPFARIDRAEVGAFDGRRHGPAPTCGVSVMRLPGHRRPNRRKRRPEAVKMPSIRAFSRNSVRQACCLTAPDQSPNRKHQTEARRRTDIPLADRRMSSAAGDNGSEIPGWSSCDSQGCARPLPAGRFHPTSHRALRRSGLRSRR